MFPLKQRILIRGAQGHLNAGLGIGADYRANYVPFVIPFDGVVSTYWGNQGGNWMRITRPNGDKIELAHLQSYAVKSGKVKEGQAGGVTGNSGGVTDFPHMHIQILDKNGKRLDPEKYDWGTQLTKTFMKLTVVANRNNWTTLQQKITILNEWFKTYSNNRLEVVSDIKHTSFQDIPFQPWESIQSVDVNWYRHNITPLATGQVTLFLVNPDQWKAPTSWGTMTYGDPQKPVRCELTSTENEGDIFISKAFHEICHALFFLTDQQDRVHEFLYQNPPKYAELLNLLDYQALQNKLVTINQGDSMLIYKFDDNATNYILTDDATLIGVTAAGLTKTLKGRPQKLVVLPAAQRGNFTIADSAIN